MKPAKIIALPRLLTVGWSNKILSLCEEAVEHDGPVTFDFSNVTWAAPFGLTTMSTVLARCLNDKKETLYVPPTDQKVRRYLERIGFDKHFLAGRDPQHISTSVELKKLTGVDPGYTDALVQIMDTYVPLSVRDKFQMKLHINELMTNGFDHSRSPVGCYVCAQWYQQNKNLRISFVDAGIGIRQSLTAVKKYGEFRNDAAAIIKSVEPGVTSRVGKAGGMGLAYIRDYVKQNRGVLTIIGGHSKVNFYYNKTETKEHSCNFQGTIVDIRIKPGQVEGDGSDQDDSIF